LIVSLSIGSMNHCIVCPQLMVGEDCLQIRLVAANILN
jgi:hypothetical protein